MKHLNIDIETYSEVDITSSGAYKYVEDPAFEVLMFAYSIDFGDVQIVDLAQGEILPDEIIKAMADDEVIKHAYNASFEYNALLAAGYDVGTRCGWRCSMFHAMYLGYPGGLARTGNAIGLPQDKKKDSAGKALINYFSKPCKPTKVNGGRLRNLPHHDLDKWEMFKDYCKQDVVAEMEIYKRLSIFPVPDIEQRLWELSDSMNALGVKVDVDLVNSALAIDDESSDRLIKRAKEVTGLDNPKSTSQVLNWLQERVDGVENTNKETVASLLSRDDISSEVREFLKIRQELAKASISKYKAMDVCRGRGDRVRGLLQVYGANRTGRWAGRLVQVQNLPRNYLDNLETIRDVIKTKNLDLLQLVCGNASDTLSQLIRTAFIPSEGNKFVVADYSAIEARVVA
nr:MAG TPA: DNA polymerase I [Caudoviricetes sp.]